MTCLCNPIYEVGSGGVELGGSATVSDSIVRGGLKCSGTATVDLVTDLYDSFSAVWPLNEDGDLTPSYLDRTRHHRHGTGGDGLDDTTVTTLDEFDGVGCQASQYLAGRNFVSCPSDGIGNSQSVTVSCWAKIESFFKPRSWFSRGYNSDTGHWVLMLGYTFASQITASVQTVNSLGVATKTTVQGATFLNQDWWYHFACVFVPASSITIYLNGVAVGSQPITDGQTIAYTNTDFIGRWNAASIPIGHIQEVRLSPEARTSDWLLAEYHDYCGAFYTVSEEQNTVYS